MSCLPAALLAGTFMKLVMGVLEGVSCNGKDTAIRGEGKVNEECVHEGIMIASYVREDLNAALCGYTARKGFLPRGRHR